MDSIVRELSVGGILENDPGGMVDGRGRWCLAIVSADLLCDRPLVLGWVAGVNGRGAFGNLGPQPTAGHATPILMAAE